MSGPYAAVFLIEGGYGELTPHPALRGHLQSTRQEPPTAVALRHAPAGAAPRGKALGLCRQLAVGLAGEALVVHNIPLMGRGGDFGHVVVDAGGEVQTAVLDGG